MTRGLPEAILQRKVRYSVRRVSTMTGRERGLRKGDWWSNAP